MKELLRVDNGSYWYQKERVLYEGLCTTVNEGEILAVLGPNGVGKTTFLRCVLGLSRWKTGKTLIGGRDIANLSPREIGRTIAYVPQARSLPFSFSVLDVVLMGRSAHVGNFAQPSKEDYIFAETALDRMGVSHLQNRYFGELSGGEAQMVFIARALASDPKIIVLDEPESHLDFRNQLVILSALRELADQDGIACIVNTHFPEHALRIADHALLLGKNGLRPKSGSVCEVLSEESLRDYFGVRVKRLGFIDGGIEYRAVYPLEPLEVSRTELHSQGVQSEYA